MKVQVVCASSASNRCHGNCSSIKDRYKTAHDSSVSDSVTRTLDMSWHTWQIRGHVRGERGSTLFMLIESRQCWGGRREQHQQLRPSLAVDRLKRNNIRTTESAFVIVDKFIMEWSDFHIFVTFLILYYILQITISKTPTFIF